ncbi:MAG: Uma2 family endonuclease [Acidobacteriota bacterium]
MAESALRKAVYDDLYSLPDGMIGEIIDGELIATPRPSRGHVHTTSTLGHELGPPYQRGRGGPGGWLIYDDPEIHFGENVLVPDLAGWRKERLAMPAKDNRFTISPDWVCEVLSPSTVRVDKVRKMPIYAAHGVPYLWLIDPAAKTLDVFELGSDSGWVIIASFFEDDRVRAKPFTEIEIELDALWTE